MINSKEHDFLFESVRRWFNQPEQISHYAHEIIEGLTVAEQYLLDTLPGMGSVLDIGCGAGRISLRLAELGYNVTGIDVSEGLLSVARKISKNKSLEIDFLHTQGIMLPFQYEKFDMIIGFKILCYIPTREMRGAFLKELHRVLKPGGTCIITQNIVPDEFIDEAKDEHYWSSPASQFGILEEGDTFPLGIGYVRWFTENNLLNEMRDTDFIIDLFKSDREHDGEGYMRLIKLLKA